MTWAIAGRSAPAPILFACLAGLTACQSDPNTRVSDADELVASLEPAVVQEREVSGVSADHFQFQAKTGDFIRVGVRQLGVDVEVGLTDPDGADQLLVDNFTGAVGEESVFALAGTEGTYRMTVKPLPPHPGVGSYRIVLSPLRPGTDQDRMLAEAALLQYSPARKKREQPGEEDLRKAIVLWQSAGEARQVAFAKKLLSDRLEDREQKIACLKEALEILETNWRLETAPFWNNLARLTRDGGSAEEVERLSLRALEIACEAGDPNEESVALNSLGLVAQSRARPWEALLFYMKSLDIARRIGQQFNEATALHNIGNVYDLLGKPAESLDKDREAMDLYRRGNHPAQEADVLAMIAGIHLQQGLWEVASQEADKAVELARSSHNEVVELRALERKGTVLLERDRPEAERIFQTALSLARRKGKPVMEAITLNSLGGLYAADGDQRRALAEHDAALSIFQGIAERVGVCYTEFLLAKAYHRFGDLFAAKKAIEVSLKTTEEVRTESKISDFKVSYFASVRERFELYVRILMDLDEKFPGRGYAAEAFDASERGRGRSLLDLLNEAKGRRLISDPMGFDSRMAHQDMARLEERLDKLGEKEGTAPIPSLGDDSPSLQAAVVELEQIQNDLLDDDTLLLSYSLGADRSYLMAVDRHSLSVHPLPPRDNLESMAERLGYALIRSRNGRFAQASLAAQKLGGVLLGPVASRLHGQRLLIVAEGKLLSIPFSALAIPSSETGEAVSDHPIPLVVEHEIVNIPSASILATLRKRTSRRPSAEKTIAVVADPVFEANDPRLPEGLADTDPPAIRFRRLKASRDEAKAILAMVAADQRFQALGFDATSELVRDGRLRPYRILHFATHAVMNAEKPDFSGLVFSLYNRRGEDLKKGYLYSFEIPDLDLQYTDLVVLSACSTGLGKPIPGEGLVGMTQAFLNAGAPRLVVSLWDVDDRATAKLMAAFYRGLLQRKLAPSAALREAQLEIMESEGFESPYYWAPFVIEGEWRGLDWKRSD